MALMGVDAGMTGVKAVVFRENGEVLSSAYREYPLHQPQRGWAELDPGELWAGTAAVIAEAASKAGEAIASIAVSSMGEAAVPVDEHGDYVARAICAFDTRTAGITRELEATIGRRTLFDITGHPPHTSYTINHVTWLKRNRPDLVERVAKFLCVQDFIGWKLSGEAAIGYSLAARTSMFDIRKRRWSERIFDVVGLSPDLFSRPIEAGAAYAHVRASAAAELGLSPETLVVAGGHDQPMCGLGAGATEEGEADLSLGTVECIANTHKKPVLNKKVLDHNFPVYNHVIPGYFTSLGYNLNSGGLLRWYRDNFAGPELAEAKATGRSVYDILFEKMPDTTTPVLVMPHLVGTGTPYLDPLSRGAIINVDLRTTREELFLACAQGTVLELMVNYRTQQKCGLAPTTINAIGGGARSAKWLQMRADALGLAINRMDVEEAGCVAAAILGGTAAGAFKDVVEGARIFARVAESYEPRPDRREVWDALYEKYEPLYGAMRKFRV
jgi:xylulokinase